jgi:signal peptidase II
MLSKNKIVICISILIFFIDRASKQYILKLSDIDNITNLEVTSFLNLNLIFNKGIAFGVFAVEDSFYYNLITIIIIIISLAVLIMALKTNGAEKYCFSMIFGGAIGNIYDRLYYSAVVDFIDVHINNIHWFIFNFADTFITIGVILLIILEIFKKKI